MRIVYKASSRDGKIKKGVIEAKDIKEAVYYLRGKDLLPITLKEQTDEPFFSFFLFTRKNNSDLVLFTRQISSMLSSGLTLMQALLILKDQTQNVFMKDTIASVITDIQEGKTFHFAITKHPQIFPPVYISLIKSGENSGLLDKILGRLADNLEKNQKLKNTIKSALLYPVIIVVLMIAVVIIMMIFVIPQLTTLYTNLNISLPFATQVVIALSNFIINFWFLVLGIFALMIFIYVQWVKTESGKLIRDEFLLHLPVLGNLIRLSILSEFSRTLGLLIGAGTLVVQSLTEISDITGNNVYKNAIVDVSHRVEKGITMGDSMATYQIFPPMLIQMIRVGEQTGKMDESLLKASEYFEREVEDGIKGLTTALEPVIMVLLGVGVAFLIISVLTPIYKLVSSTPQ